MPTLGSHPSSPAADAAGTDHVARILWRESMRIHARRLVKAGVVVVAVAAVASLALDKYGVSWCGRGLGDDDDTIVCRELHVYAFTATPREVTWHRGSVTTVSDFYANGELAYEKACDDVTNICDVREWWATGAQRFAGHQRSDVREGMDLWWNESGSLELRSPIHDGLREGVTMSFAPDGHVTEMAQYHHGAREGWTVTFAESGVPERAERFVDDAPQEENRSATFARDIVNNGLMQRMAPVEDLTFKGPLASD